MSDLEKAIGHALQTKGMLIDVRVPESALRADLPDERPVLFVDCGITHLIIRVGWTEHGPTAAISGFRNHAKVPLDVLELDDSISLSPREEVNT